MCDGTASCAWYDGRTRHGLEHSRCTHEQNITHHMVCCVTTSHTNDIHMSRLPQWLPHRLKHPLLPCSIARRLTFLRHQPDVLVAIRLEDSLGRSRAVSTDYYEHEHEGRGHCHFNF